MEFRTALRRCCRCLRVARTRLLPHHPRLRPGHSTPLPAGPMAERCPIPSPCRRPPSPTRLLSTLPTCLPPVQARPPGELWVSVPPERAATTHRALWLISPLRPTRVTRSPVGPEAWPAQALPQPPLPCPRRRWYPPASARGLR